MSFYKLGYDYSVGDKGITCVAKELFGIDQYDVDKGQEISNWNEQITFEFDPVDGGLPTDYLSNDLGWLIVSDKFRTALSTNKIEGVQFLPVQIINKQNGESLSGYSVANILRVEDALDLSNSKFEEWDLGDDEILLSVEVYAIKEEKVAGVHIFKLHSDPLPRFVSGKCKEVIETNDLIGFDFIQVRAT